MVLLQLTALTNKVLASGNNHNASGSNRWIDRTNVRPWRPTHYGPSVSRCIDLHSLTVLSSSSHYFDLLIAKVWFLALLTHCHNTKFEDCIAQHSVVGNYEPKFLRSGDLSNFIDSCMYRRQDFHQIWHFYDFPSWAKALLRLSCGWPSYPVWQFTLVFHLLP